MNLIPLAGNQSGPVHPIGVDMKPDWKDAPEWAKWLAMDEDGVWCWFESEPELESTFWVTDDKYQDASEPVNKWKDSLEARPDDSPNPTP